MVSQQDWLDEGLLVLAGVGAGGLRIETLAARLGVSKGSFYHHFAGMSGYRIDLLSHYEAEFTARYIAAVETDPAMSPVEKLSRLQRAVLDDERPDLEVAMRAWAASDDDARTTQERIDAQRTEYLNGLCTEITGDERTGLDLALTLYLLLIGARHVVPALTNVELGRLYDRALSQLEVSPS